jgi:hypothetical protein
VPGGRVTGDAAEPDRARIEAAITDLSELRSTDPAARPAVHAINLTRITLESFWRRIDDRGS